jgi:hypothetical protein
MQRTSENLDGFSVPCRHGMSDFLHIGSDASGAIESSKWNQQGVILRNPSDLSWKVGDWYARTVIATPRSPRELLVRMTLIESKP